MKVQSIKQRAHAHTRTHAQRKRERGLQEEDRGIVNIKEKRNVNVRDIKDLIVRERDTETTWKHLSYGNPSDSSVFFFPFCWKWKIKAKTLKFMLCFLSPNREITLFHDFWGMGTEKMQTPNPSRRLSSCCEQNSLAACKYYHLSFLC